MKFVLRREILFDETFIELAIQIGKRRYGFAMTRPHKVSDLPFHIAKEFGGKNA